MAYVGVPDSFFAKKLLIIQEKIIKKELIDKYTCFLTLHDSTLRGRSHEQYACIVYQLLLAALEIPTPLDAPATRSSVCVSPADRPVTPQSACLAQPLWTGSARGFGSVFSFFFGSKARSAPTSPKPMPT